MRRSSGARLARPTTGAADERHPDQSEDHERRPRIAGQADDRDPGAVREQRRLSRLDRKAVAPRLGVRQGGDRAGGFEVKLYGTEGVLFDIAEHPWTGTEPLPPAEKAAAAD